MEMVEFAHVEVLDDTGGQLLCLIAGRRVVVPSLLVQPGTAVRCSGDRGTLVVPRWLGIGLGLVWPFAPGTERRPPARALRPDAGPARRVSGGGS